MSFLDRYNRMMMNRKIRIAYRIDEQGKVVRMQINKREHHRTAQDVELIDSLSTHFVGMGMAVIVED